MSAPTKQTLRQAWDEFIEAAKAGLVLAAGKDASTIRNTIAPVRVLYRQAVDDIPVNPTARLQLPSSEGRRDRIATPEEAAELIGALQQHDRALWASAMYAGLRRGELLALRLEDVDLPAGLIRVERSYDPRPRQFVTPKSRAGTRTVPIPKVLRGHLSAHKLTLGRSEGLIFGATAERPFTGSNASRRAETAWKRANKIRENEERPLLEPIGLHECRHTFASVMIAAGVNAKGSKHVHGAQLHHDHPRSLRAPVPRQRGRSSGTTRHLFGGRVRASRGPVRWPTRQSLAVSSGERTCTSRRGNACTVIVFGLCCGVAPGGVEPPRTDSKSVALSAELRGHAEQRSGV